MSNTSSLAARIVANRKRRETRALMAAPVARSHKIARRQPATSARFDRTVTATWLPNDEHAAWAQNYLARRAAAAAAAAAAREGWQRAIENAPAKLRWFDQERLPKEDTAEYVEIDGVLVCLEPEPHEAFWSGEFCPICHVEHAVIGAAGCEH